MAGEKRKFELLSVQLGLGIFALVIFVIIGWLVLG